MEDPELIALKKLKEELVIKAQTLIEELKKRENNEDLVELELVPEYMEDVNNENENITDERKDLFYEITRKITGISYENVDRKWLYDNIYKYTADLITDALNANIELLIKIESEEEFEVSDITCHFINIKKCQILEIQPWVQNYTEMKNFSFLTFAISQYNKESTVRKKMLDSLEKYVYCEECLDKNGGFYVHLQSSKHIRHTYLTFQWSVLLLERSLQIGHYFIIKPQKNGLKFARKNESILEKFNKKNTTREELHLLWSELCSAVDLYDNKNQDESPEGNEDETFDLHDNGNQGEPSTEFDTTEESS